MTGNGKYAGMTAVNRNDRSMKGYEKQLMIGKVQVTLPLV
jgi:hypothetical protein